MSIYTMNQVDRFFSVMDTQHLKVHFQKFADEATLRMPCSQFLPALQEMGVESAPERAADLFKEADIDEDGGLDLDEFIRVIRRTTELEQWCSTLPLSKLLSFCLETPFKRANTCAEISDPIRTLLALSSNDFAAVAEEFCVGLKRLLVERARELESCYEVLDRKAAEGSNGSSAKFQSFTMSAGSAMDFHRGLTDRVGKLPDFAYDDLLSGGVRGRRAASRLGQGPAAGALRDARPRQAVRDDQLDLQLDTYCTQPTSDKLVRGRL